MTPAIVGIALAMACSAMSAVGQPAPDAKAGPEIYQTFYLTNLTQENDANEF